MRCALEAVEELDLVDRDDRRLRHRLLHRVLQQPRRRGAPGAARPGTVGGHRGEAGQARHLRVHHPGRRRHGQRGSPGGAPHRGPRREVTCVMLNNGVFGETGGHMTATTVLGQRTKTSLEGRDPVATAAPSCSPLVAQLDGAAFVARGRGQHRRQRGPDQAATCSGPSRPSAPVRGSRSSRSSPCARPDGSSRPRRRPATSPTPRRGPHPRRAEGRPGRVTGTEPTGRTGHRRPRREGR